MKKKNDSLLKNLPEAVKVHIKHLERVRSDFVANVSHELRTPLTVIQGYLETLLKQESDDTKPWKKVFTQMLQHSTRMGHIIEDLLLLSELETDDFPTAEAAKIRVAALLKTLYEEAQQLNVEKKHRITLKSDAKVLLIGSENELKSLFSNLIINAIKYTPPHGKISIEWYAENKQAIFKVIDSGLGIAKKDIPRITERFYRVDKARSRGSGGTGLGLAIVKHIVLRHQAELQIESKLGKGSTFTCVFPAHQTIIQK